MFLKNALMSVLLTKGNGLKTRMEENDHKQHLSVVQCRGLLPFRCFSGYACGPRIHPNNTLADLAYNPLIRQFLRALLFPSRKHDLARWRVHADRCKSLRWSCETSEKPLLNL